MVNTRRTLAATSASSGLPQDPMTTDPNVRVPATTVISTNLMDVGNPANPAGPKKLNQHNCSSRPYQPNLSQWPGSAGQGRSAIGTFFQCGATPGHHNN
uniref:Uncharacterized protein n=1 Tax=Cannabis sativa TaxID=3483 RepID=A0A803NI25_CANSA